MITNIPHADTSGVTYSKNKKNPDVSPFIHLPDI